jgi:hypothetical protein
MTTPISNEDLLDSLDADLLSGVEEIRTPDFTKRKMDPAKRYDLIQKRAADQEAMNGPFIKARFKSRNW